MKAEHRKELETNILADRMGRVLRGTQETPTTTIWYWLVGVCLVLLVFFLVQRWFAYRSETSAKNWAAFEGGDQQELFRLAQQNATQNVGKAARFQIAFEKLWTVGISKLGGNTVEAKNNILDARDDYDKLAKDCQYEPAFLGEALYGMAVADETLAIEDPEKLKTAVTSYKRVTKEAKDTAFAKLAEERIYILDVPAAVEGEDAKTREEREVREKKLDDIARMYKYLRSDLLRPRMPGIPGMPGRPTSPEEEQKMLEELKAKHPEFFEKLKPAIDTKLPEIKGPEVKVPDAKAPEPKAPDGKSPDGKSPDGKTPDAKGPDGKDKLPTIAPPPAAPPIPPAPQTSAPAPKTPDAKPDDKKSDKK